MPISLNFTGQIFRLGVSKTSVLRGAKIETNIIFNGDCTNGMEAWGGQADLILTDPPFNLSVKNNFHTLKGRHGIDFGEWDNGFDLTGWIPAAIERLRMGGSILVFTAWRNMGTLATALESSGCLVKEMLQWKKSNPMPRNRDRLYVTSCEFAIWATKGKGWVFNRQRETYENTIFEYPIVSAKQRIHTTQKPVELMQDLILIHSNPDDIVLDPFMGSGTTAIAAIRTGRRFVGFEIDDTYYTLANERIDIECEKSA